MHPDLARWHAALDDAEQWLDFPPAMYRNQLAAADRLLAQGVIDPLERFDLVELATAARDWALEMLADDYLQPARQYRVITLDGRLAGEMDGFKLSLQGDATRYLGRRGLLGHWLIDTTMGHCRARVVGDEVRFVTGERYRIVHVSTRVQDVSIPVSPEAGST